MNKDQVNDVVFEALFRQAVIDGFDEEIDSIPTNEQLANPSSGPINPCLQISVSFLLTSLQSCSKM